MTYEHYTKNYRAEACGDYYNLYKVDNGFENIICQLPADMIEGSEDWLPERKSLSLDFMSGLNLTPNYNGK